MQEIEKICALGRAVISAEASTIAALVDRIDHQFGAACLQLLACQGRIIVMGMGKSGHIAKKFQRPFRAKAVLHFLFTPVKRGMGIGV